MRKAAKPPHGDANLRNGDGWLDLLTAELDATTPEASAALRLHEERINQELDAIEAGRHPFSTEAAFLLAAKLYEPGRLTSGQAANLCGKERVAFLLDLPRAHVPISNLSADDAEDELAFAQGVPRVVRGSSAPPPGVLRSARRP